MVAAVMEDFSSLLAIKAGASGDMGVYEFNGDQEDDERIENLGNKEGRVKDTRLAFHSYAEMLEQISEIKIGDEIYVSEKNKTEAKGHKVYSIDKEDCLECGSCAEECQNGSITQEDGYYSINPDTCTNCGDCADICPVEIIKKR
jgi:ferredoxin